MATYSHSRLSTFEQCRLKFKYQYLDKLETEQEETVETFLGSLVHEALEKLYKDLRFEKRLAADELVAWFSEEWRKRWNPSTMRIAREEYAAENYRLMGERYLKEYYARYAPFDQGKTIGLETEEMLQLDDERSYHVRIDRLVDDGQGVYEIHDYKTGSLKTQEELETDRQLAMYAYWVHRSFPDARKVRLVWHFLAFDKEMAVEKEMTALEELKASVLELIREVELTTDFPPTRSALCNWCEYQPVCPLWKHKFETDALAPEEFKKEDGVRLVDEYAELKEREREIKERIERTQNDIYSYAGQHGVQAVYGSAQKLTVWSKGTVKLPGKNDLAYPALVRLTKEQGLYDNYSMLDTWKLADALAAGTVRIDGFIPRKETVRRLYAAKR